MPFYKHVCDDGHNFDLFLRFSELEDLQACVCGRPATRVICAPMVFVQQDICYLSPVDGRPITNKQARLEDLKRNNCIEYDPCMRQDYQRRIEEGEKRLDAEVDQTVERAIATLPPRKLEKLTAEIEGGLTPEPQRVTPEQARSL